MQDIYNEVFNENAMKYLIDIKERYKESFKIPIEEKIFRIEEELYKYIKRNFPNHWQNKIKLAEKIRKNNFKTWEEAYRHKYMQDSKISSYSDEEQNVLKQIYNEFLCAYYSLKIFADSRFDKNKIMSLPNPDNFAFAMFRLRYPDDRHFNLIVDDLISYIAEKSSNKNQSVLFGINYALLKGILTEAEIVLAEKLFTRKPLKKIAKELNKSENTLKTQRNTIYDKLLVKNQEEFIEKITQKGW